MRKAVATTAAAIPMMSAQGHPGDEKGSACEPECFSVWRRIALRSNSRRRLPHLGIIRALGITNGSQESASVRGCLSAVPTFGPAGVKRTCRPRRLRECEDCRYLSVSVLLVDGFRVAKDTGPTQRWFVCEPRVPHGHRVHKIERVLRPLPAYTREWIASAGADHQLYARAACTVSRWLSKKAWPSAATTLLSHVASTITFVPLSSFAQYPLCQTVR